MQTAETTDAAAQAALRNAARRVLVVAPQPFYADRGTPIAVSYVLKALHAVGFEVDLLTVPIGLDINIPGGTIHRVSNPFRMRSMAVGFSMTKLFFDVLLGWKTWKMMHRTRYSCVHAVEESVFLALIARAGRDIPIVYDMASELPAHLAEKRVFRGRAAQALITRAERWALHGSSAVVCSAGLADHVRRVAPKTAVFEWRFPSQPSASSRHAAEALRGELGIPSGSRVVAYTGNFAEYQGVDLLLAAAKPLLERHPDVYLVCVGASDSREIEAAWRTVQGAAQERIRLLPRQPRARVDGFTAMADVLVSPRSSQGNFPLKIFDYLAAGKPIVATNVASHRCVLDETLALLCDCTTAGLVEGISRVLTEGGLGAMLATNARIFADRELSWRSFEELVSKVYAAAMTDA